MKIGALSFLNRTNSPYTFSIAAWHSWHSLTWRWLLHFQFFRGNERRIHWYVVWWNRHNSGWQGLFLIPFVGLFWFETQRPMWYRDLFNRRRDEDERLESESSRSRMEMAERPAGPLH